MFNVGFAGFKKEFVDKIKELNQKYPRKVDELFGSIAGVTPTARSQDRIPGGGIDKVEEALEWLKGSGISLKWTLNHSCFGGMQDLDYPRLRDAVGQLVDLGITRYIVTIPVLLRALRKDFPQITLEVSTISRVRSAREVMEWIKLGANGFCWDVMGNRDFDVLQNSIKVAKEHGAYIEILVNELCTWPCIYRNHCYNLSSHNSIRTVMNGYPYGWCTEEKAADPWKWIATRFVLPEHLDYYLEMGVERFKISGRTRSPETILPIVEWYMKGESPEDLLDLWPHVSVLVGGEVRPELRISTKLVKTRAFLNRFKWVDCDSACQVTCFYCNKIFEASKMEKKVWSAPLTVKG